MDGVIKDNRSENYFQLPSLSESFPEARVSLNTISKSYGALFRALSPVEQAIVREIVDIAKDQPVSTPIQFSEVLERVEKLQNSDERNTHFSHEHLVRHYADDGDFLMRSTENIQFDREEIFAVFSKLYDEGVLHKEDGNYAAGEETSFVIADRNFEDWARIFFYHSSERNLPSDVSETLHRLRTPLDFDLVA